MVRFTERKIFHLTQVSQQLLHSHRVRAVHHVVTVAHAVAEEAVETEKRTRTKFLS